MFAIDGEKLAKMFLQLKENWKFLARYCAYKKCGTILEIYFFMVKNQNQNVNKYKHPIYVKKTTKKFNLELLLM